MISSRKSPVAAITALVVSVLLLPGIAGAEDTGEGIREAARELRKANDAGQVGQRGETTYTFGQNVSVFDLQREPGVSFGPTSRLTPGYGTSASFPALSYEPIPEAQSSFGFSFRF